jgi:hypothetical protein
MMRETKTAWMWEKGGENEMKTVWMGEREGGEEAKVD